MEVCFALLSFIMSNQKRIASSSSFSPHRLHSECKRFTWNLKKTPQKKWWSHWSLKSTHCTLLGIFLHVNTSLFLHLARLFVNYLRGSEAIYSGRRYTEEKWAKYKTTVMGKGNLRIRSKLRHAGDLCFITTYPGYLSNF